MNWDLRGKLDNLAKEYEKKGVILAPYSCCCSSCLNNKYDKLMGNYYFFKFFLDGMNYTSEGVDTIYIEYKELEAVSKNRLRKVIKRYAELIGGGECKIHWPSNDSECIRVDFENEIELEEDYNDFNG